MRYLYVFLAAAALGGMLAPAVAQNQGPHVISGTITSVNGHLVTIQRSTGTITVNDQPALNNQTTGNVAVGRQVVARGYWQGGTFYATSFADANVYGATSMPGGGPILGRLRGVVRGNVTTVNGHLVTVSNGTDSIVIDDQPALNRKLTGNVTVGRSIAAIGYWRGGTFYATTIDDANDASSVPQGAPDFGTFRHIPDSISGTITGVSGNQITLQQASGTVVVNDQPALNARSTGNVAVGRAVVANGYWLHGTFYATSFDDATP
jgi:hypothetical protein